MAKEVKTRTSITIDPTVLAEVKKATDTNVSKFVEEACKAKLEADRAKKEE